MSRAVTLFTGQWADLSFDAICAKAKSFGYDGLELACWGDHFDVAAALSDSKYVKGRWKILQQWWVTTWERSSCTDIKNA